MGSADGYHAWTEGTAGRRRRRPKDRNRQHTPSLIIVGQRSFQANRFGHRPSDFSERGSLLLIAL
jgi:hypothetical protein